MDKRVTCENVFGEKFEVSIDELSFRPSVYGVVVKDRKILLVKQYGGYNLPGGGIEIGETINKALIREIKEETGLDVKVGDLITCKDSFFKYHAQEKYVQSILLYYVCNVIGGDLLEVRFTDDEKEYCDKPEWIELEKINKIKLYSTVDIVEVIKTIDN